MAVLATDRSRPALRGRIAGGELEAPHLIDLEFLQALRRMVRRGELSEDRANDARVLLDELNLTRFPHEPLSDRIWELRHNLTAYDAAFVALAEVLSEPLITCDARLASTKGIAADVELY